MKQKQAIGDVFFSQSSLQQWTHLEAGSDRSTGTVNPAKHKGRKVEVKVEVYPVLSSASRRARSPSCPQNCSPCRPISKHTFHRERRRAQAVKGSVSKCVCAEGSGGGRGGGRRGGRGEPKRGFLWRRRLQRANELPPAGVLSADCLLPALWRSNYKRLCLPPPAPPPPPLLSRFGTLSLPSSSSSSLLLPVQPDLPFPLLFSSSNFHPPFPLFPHALSHPAFIIPPPPPFSNVLTKQMNDFGPSVTRQL